VSKGLLPESRYCRHDYQAQNQIGSHFASTELTSDRFDCSLLASFYRRKNGGDIRQIPVVSAKTRCGGGDFGATKDENRCAQPAIFGQSS
jgi:hypothetical protein